MLGLSEGKDVNDNNNNKKLKILSLPSQSPGLFISQPNRVCFSVTADKTKGRNLH